MSKTAQKRSRRRREDPDEPTEAELRLLFGLGPDDPLPEIRDATCPIALTITPETEVEEITDAEGNVVGYSLEGIEVEDLN